MGGGTTFHFVIGGFDAAYRARARFKLTARTVNSDNDDVLRSDGSAVNPRVEITLTNTGDLVLAAG